MKTIYQLTKWHRNSLHPEEQTVAFYESWKDANNKLELLYLEMNSKIYDYAIYTHKVIKSSEDK